MKTLTVVMGILFTMCLYMGVKSLVVLSHIDMVKAVSK